MRTELHGILAAAGWEDSLGPRAEPGMERNDWRFDLSGDYGYPWHLQKADSNGGWKSAKDSSRNDVEGDAHELAKILPHIGRPQIPGDWWREPGWDAASAADQERQCEIEEAVF